MRRPARAIAAPGESLAFGQIAEGQFLKRVGDQVVGASSGSGSYNDLTDKPETFPPAEHQHDDEYASIDHTHPGGSEALPVGSVFLAVVSTDPNELLGYGTWSAFGAGRMLVGFNAADADFDTAEKTGGAKTVTLTAAQSGLPQHTHTQNIHNHTQDAHTHTQNAHTHVQDAHAHTLPVGATDDTAAAFDRADAGSNTGGANATTSVGTTTAVNQNATAVNQNATATNQAATAVNQNAGPTDASQAHNNLSPYIVVYLWKRTA